MTISELGTALPHWRELWPIRIRSALGIRIIGVAALVAVAVGVGLMSAGLGATAIIAAVAILFLGIAAVDLSLVPMLAMPMTLLQMRAGGVLAYSDVILAIGAVLALMMLRGRGAAALQPLVWAGTVYLALMIPTLVLNPFSANLVEWVHEVFLVIGSLLIGFVLAREGNAKAAFTLYGLACAFIGVWACIFTVQHGFEAAYLPTLQKNTTGGMLAVSVVIACARPAWLGWRPWFANLVLLLSGLGVLASQSRQGMIGGLVGAAVVSLRPRLVGSGRGRKLIWLAAIPLVIVVWTEVAAQLGSSNQFNSAHQRLAWFAQSVQVWQSSPVFGVGLRWWYTAKFGVSFQPPNAEFEVLTCGGIVGLAGFLLMFIAACWILIKLDPIYGTLGLAVVLTRFTQAQFDLYWVAGQASLLWIVAGACYGAMERDKALGIDRRAPQAASFPTRLSRVGAR